MESSVGFNLLFNDQKRSLIGVPFFIIDFELKRDKDKSRFVECLIITAHNSKYTLRDSKGIYEQLNILQKRQAATNHRNPNATYFAHKGLIFVDQTYYLAV